MLKYLAAFTLPMLAAACAAPDPQEVRQKETVAYLEAAARVVKELFPPGRPLSLEQCHRLALEHNPSLRAASLEKEAARMARRRALGELLFPRVDVNLTATDRSNDPALQFGGGRASFSDKDLRLTTTQVSIPLVDLYSHFLLARARRGEEIAAWAELAVRQNVVARVTAEYGALVALEAAREAVEAAGVQARKEADRLVRLAGEGLALALDRDRAEEKARRAVDRIASHARELALARRRLEESMGLPPVGHIRVEPRMDIVAPAGDPAALVRRALLQRPELFARDRAVLMAKEESRAALARFLPRLVGIGSLETSSDGNLVHGHWAAGAVTLTANLFEGFAGLARRAQEQREVELEKERRRELYATIVLQVLSAWRELRDARPALARAEEEAETALGQLQQARALVDQGLLGPSSLAAVVAAVRGAEAARESARVREGVAAAMLRLALGEGGVAGQDAGSKGEGR